MSRRLDIIVPVYNEEASLVELTRRINSSLQKAKIPYSIIFVDDHSTDDTRELITRLSQKYPIRLVVKRGMRGKAFSIIEGIRASSAPFMAMIDGDLEYPPEAIPQMYPQLAVHGVVVANRTKSHSSLLRKIGSHLNTFIFGRLLLGLNCDVQSGLKLFRREVAVHLSESDVRAWAIDMPLLHTARELGYSIGVVPITFTPRESGSSQARSEFFQAAREISTTAIRLRFSPGKIYSLPPASNSSMAGAGMIYRRRGYVTHSTLPHHYSAIVTLHRLQKLALLGALALMSVSFLLWPQSTAITLVGLLSAIYFADVVFNFILIYRSLKSPPEISISVAQLQNWATDKLPVYTILCPLYHEARVLPQFVENISQLDWPKDKLEVLLLLEEDDHQTREAAKNLALPDYFHVVVVPHSNPKTKPKACNYGLSRATGEYIVIYDAEDRPEPDQLKKAYFTFTHRVPPQTACLQAKLNYYNPHHNLLTRLFTTEYSLWFDVVLPGLQSLGTTIPLGGTSNHFRTTILKSLHGWDAFNVTEDCDLGARLFKEGYTTAIIDSTTLEEANSDLGNWLRQRSRWIKGYLQTFFVHNRHPLRFLKSHGWHALIFQLIVGGRIAFMLINPFLWLATISYFALYKYVGPTIESLYPAAIFYLAAFSAIFGNFLYLYYYMIGCAKRGRWELVKYVFAVPLYWLFISLAAFKAFWQLVFRPYYWEKTHHGLHLFEVSKEARQSWLSSLRNFVSHQFGRLGVLPQPLLKGGTLLVASTMLSNFFNFLYNIYLGRAISIEEFSLVGLMGSIAYLVQIPTTALSKTLSHRVAFLLGQKNRYVNHFWNFIKSRVLYISLGVTAVWIAVIPWMSRVFQANGNTTPFFLITPLWLATALVATNRGFLAGHHRFAVLAAMVTVESVSKFAFAVFFVRLGWPQYIYASHPLSLVAALAVCWLAVRAIKPQIVATKTLQSAPHFPFRFFSTSILIKLSSLAFLSLDVILAKIYLPPAIAGQYVLISLAGKIVYFLGSLFDPFIIPVVSRAEGEGANPKPLFYRLLLGNSVTSIMGFVALGPLGSIFAPLLFGPKIISVIPLLTWYCLAMVNFTLSGSIVNYHQARRQYVFPILGFILASLQPVLVYFFHSSLADLVTVMLVLSLVYLGSFLMLHFYYQFSWSVTNNIRDLWDLLIRFFPRELSPSKSDSLRILIFNWRDIRHKWAGGAEVYIHELGKRWAAQGHTVTIFCGNDGNCPRKETIDGVKIIRHGGFYTVYFWAVIYYLLRLRNRFDIVIDSENGIPFFTPLFARIPKILLIHHIHQDKIIFQGRLPFPVAQFAMALESRLMPLVYHNQKIITVSESSKNDIVRIGLSRPEDITIVNPGITLREYIRKAPKTKNPSFVYVGRIRPYKNIDVAIRAFSQVVRDHPKARLNIAGVGEGIKELRHLAEDLNLSNNVYFLGRVTEKEKVQLLSQSWAMLQPSSFEGWGITVIEANACGTPAIASDVIGLRDSVRHNQTGILVPPLDPYTLANTIKSLIHRPSILKYFSKNSQAWSRQFSWESQSRSFLEAVKLLLVPEIDVPLSHQPAYEYQ
ncbi:hypothetical protein A2634_05175 [Candidatus Amesbacteria bacterium RIFCSPHIGHO2_01_FULL_48_32]|uniref:Glycosyltransferase 2-like domain-containing protein n=1 Tax=Candidatus Amesbacteria bacterium RIFCSPLOWO2_01_FULL_48_25 TaxID=1797259 RepID=A0A1F4ZCJ9_9BACT|nr:MAG: hypothetical protein A2634_05175 [Candidatus Amesbacteria bacterium RIFCSPHIGHO2_01_FULL_48_32]OGD04060.1 MAG: hypothetical protein A2989_01520 [Candidatus Amesbacteria bacterium RIFCSPLOWO2_01_FULL_48_25]HJZ05676.1 glycosyltransferase [Patescibacteria group bacterium]